MMSSLAAPGLLIPPQATRRFWSAAADIRAIDLGIDWSGLISRRAEGESVSCSRAEGRSFGRYELRESRRVSAGDRYYENQRGTKEGGLTLIRFLTPKKESETWSTTNTTWIFSCYDPVIILVLAMKTFSHLGQAACSQVKSNSFTFVFTTIFQNKIALRVTPPFLETIFTAVTSRPTRVAVPPSVTIFNQTDMKWHLLYWSEAAADWSLW